MFLLRGLLQVGDFYSDIMFTIYLWETFDSKTLITKHDYTERTSYYAIVSTFFVVFPIFSNVYVLLKEQKKWSKGICGFHYRSWINSFSTEILLMTIVTGSVFATIDFCNVKCSTEDIYIYIYNFVRFLYFCLQL